MRPDGLHPPHHNDGFAHDHGGGAPTGARAPRIGIGGPVGSGKTALVAALCRTLRTELTIGVVTNDIYTTEDADFLRRAGVLPDARIRAVQTGACPHTAIRDDITPNLDAVEQLEADHPDLDLVLVESGGDNLTATFSYGLVHRQIFVIDVAGGDKVPRKGGPGVTRSDLLVINKIDLAPLVGADLEVMRRDALAGRGARPTLFTSLATDPGASTVADWVRQVRAVLTPRVKAHTRAVVHPGGRLGELHCTPPLTLRRVHAESADVCALCLVGSAAGPLAGDELIGELVVEAGARATLTATGASIAQGRNGPAASLAWRVDVGTSAHVVADPGPLIVCEGSRVDVSVEIALATDSHLEWHELVVLGRSTDAAAGVATIGWDVTRAGRPLLRQSVDLADSWARSGHRVLAGALLTGPDVAARTVVHSRTAVAQQIDPHTALLTVLGDSAADVTRALASLRAEF